MTGTRKDRSPQLGFGRREILRIAGTMGIGAFSLSVSHRALAAGLHNSSALPGMKPPVPVALKPQQSKITVVIDAGHGGIDPGCIGFSGCYEKDVALATAREVARQLEALKRFRVVLTREDDRFIPLEGRVAKARAADGDMLLSLHADAIPDAAVRGASVFTLSDHATDGFAAAVAQRENKSDAVAGLDLSHGSPEVNSILMDLARRQTSNLSQGLAQELVAELGRNVRMLENSHRAADFAVLKAPDVPSALVEMGCLSNREEDKLLRSPAYQKKVAASIVHSVTGYFDTVVRTRAV